MVNKKLSICIATYNRAHLIGETLQSILPQVTDEIDVLIVDGASPDNTEDVVRSFQEKYAQLRYVRLPTKGGVDQDYDKSVELAEGEYCWLFTDDDVLNPGAIKAVLEALQKGYNLVLVNAEIRNVDLSQKLSERILHNKSDVIYEDDVSSKENFFAENGSYLTFIGCVVVKRDLWLSRDRQKYFGTRFIHVGVIFQSYIPGKLCVIASPLISIRLGNAEWANLGFEIWMFKWPELIWSFYDFSDHNKLAICRRFPWKRLHALIYYRAIGNYTLDEYNKHLERRLEQNWQRFIARIIAYIPFKITNDLLRCYAMLKQNHVLMFLLNSCRISYNKR